MKIEIKHKYSGSVLFSLETKNIRLAVEAAIKSSANLRYADLSSADLRYADLRSADLSYANLSYAKGINKYLANDLYLLLEQTGDIRAYKLVNSNNEGTYNGGITYIIGENYSVDDFNSDENDECGSGINLATLAWCLRYWQNGYKILVAEFTKKDIVCIPISSDGKFRVKACKIIKEIPKYKYGKLPKEAK